MDIQLRGNPILDGVQEPAELAAAMSTVTLPDHCTGLDIQRRKQRCGSVTLVIMAAPLWLSRSHRQQRLCSVQSLNLRFLVNTQNQGAIGRIQVETNDIPHL